MGKGLSLCKYCGEYHGNIVMCDEKKKIREEKHRREERQAQEQRRIEASKPRIQIIESKRYKKPGWGDKLQNYEHTGDNVFWRKEG